MELTIFEVHSNSDLKAFIKFPMRLYAKAECYVPPLMSFEMSTLKQSKNPAFDHSKAKYWMVKKGDEIVGRIAAIILNQELTDKQMARFGWIDFIDDYEVSRLLLNTAAEWAKKQGAMKIHGPLGFTDLDFEGALIEGFDQLATQATIYNFPYYQSHYENYGMEKAVDWIERRGYVPEKVSERLQRAAELSQKRYGFRSVKVKRNRDLKVYAPAVFRLLNDTYSHLYGYYPLSEKQIRYYTNQYFDFIKKEFVSVIIDKEGELAAMAICVPSISRGLQKAKGNLFPFGFIPVLKDFYSNNTVDLFLIAVHPKHQKTGVNGLIFRDVLSAFIKYGVNYVATGPMLEENSNVRNLWKEFTFNTSDSIRRRCYVKSIGK